VLIAVALLLCLALGCSNQTQTMDDYLDAVMLRELGQEELAIEKLKVVTDADPGFALAYTELGKAYEAIGQKEEAAQAFRKATQLDPWSFEGNMNLAHVYERLERFSGAAHAYARAAELEPDNLEAQMGAAECLLKTGQVVEALAHGEAACRIDEKSREALLLLGRIYEAQKDYPLAIQVYQRLLGVDPSDADAMLALATVYMKDAQFERAQDVLTSLVRVRPNLTIAYRHLGYCLVSTDRPDQAIQMYAKAIDLDSEDWQAHRGLGVAYMVKANQANDAHAEAQAVYHWRRALEINPDQPKREALEKLIKEHSETSNPLQGLDY
jgi:tetratricopeptide (TPR) repeat protein